MKETIMKMNETLKGKTAYVGAGAGLCLFAVFGLLHSSFIGGLVGINIAGTLFGYPITPSLLSRGIIALGMLMGVIISGLLFVLAGTGLGWVTGLTIESLTSLGKKADSTKDKD